MAAASDSLHQIVNVIEASSLSNGIKNVDGMIPITQSIHILAIAVVMSSIVMLNMRVAGLTRSTEPFERLTRRYLPWVWSALPVLLLTGLVLIVAEPGRELLNRFFWYKMGLLLFVVVLTARIQMKSTADPLAELPPALRGQMRAIAIVSLIAWFAIITCGRWIAYA